MAIAMVTLLSLVACAEKQVPDSDIFTLYSNAPSDKFARLHEATFDARQAVEMNAHHCERVQRLLQEWYNTTTKTTDVKFWCEKGRYRK
jgi:hypothetical protein